MVVSSLRHDRTGQAVFGIEHRSGVGMNPDPFAPTDLDSPLRFDHLLHLLLGAVAWVAAVAGVTAAVLVAWRLRSPETYELHFAAPARRLRWRLWAYATWERLSKRCGLSASEQVTGKDNEGRSVTQTRWTHPKLLQVNASDNCLTLTVRTRLGLTVEDLERAVPAIRDAAEPMQPSRSWSHPAPCGSNWSCASNSRQSVMQPLPLQSLPPESRLGAVKTAPRGPCKSPADTP